MKIILILLLLGCVLPSSAVYPAITTNSYGTFTSPDYGTTIDGLAVHLRAVQEFNRHTSAEINDLKKESASIERTFYCLLILDLFILTTLFILFRRSWNQEHRPYYAASKSL